MLPQLSRSSRYLLLVAAVGTVSAISVNLSRADSGQASARDNATAVRGKAHFTGSEPLTGRIREHDDPMPAAVLTCANCHATHTQTAVKASDAPVLSASFLNDPRSRRHGPASAYDYRTFCRVLRTGVDPAFVLIDHTMPVYQLTDGQCQSLWRYLQKPNVVPAIRSPDA